MKNVKKNLFVVAILFVVSVSPSHLYAQAGADYNGAAQAQANPTSTPTPRPTAVPQLTSFTAACTLNYIFNDALYSTTGDRTCGMLVTFLTATGSYFYPARCTIARGARSCSARVTLASVRRPLPPGAAIQRILVSSEKINAQWGMEESLGCTYNGNVVADAVYNAQGLFTGANILHQLYCAAAPV